MHTPSPTHSVTLAGICRQLPLFEVKPGLRIAVLNMLGDTELTEASGIALAKKLVNLSFDTLVTAEAKSIPLLHVLSRTLQKPCVVLRKTYKSYMGVALVAETISITTGKPQRLYIDEKDHGQLSGKQVVLIDDVISTGSTMEGMKKLMSEADATISAIAAVCTEGDPAKWQQVIALGHLPVFNDSSK
jgi:adenine phosphoribosyltransferase